MTIRVIKQIRGEFRDIDFDADNNARCDTCKKDGIVLTIEIAENGGGFNSVNICPDCLRDLAAQVEAALAGGDA